MNQKQTGVLLVALLVVMGGIGGFMWFFIGNQSPSVDYPDGASSENIDFNKIGERSTYEAYSGSPVAVERTVTLNHSDGSETQSAVYRISSDRTKVLSDDGYYTKDYAVLQKSGRNANLQYRGYYESGPDTSYLVYPDKSISSSWFSVPDEVKSLDWSYKRTQQFNGNKVLVYTTTSGDSLYLTADTGVIVHLDYTTEVKFDEPRTINGESVTEAQKSVSYTTRQANNEVTEPGWAVTALDRVAGLNSHPMQLQMSMIESGQALQVNGGELTSFADTISVTTEDGETYTLTRESGIPTTGVYYIENGNLKHSSSSEFSGQGDKKLSFSTVRIKSTTPSRTISLINLGGSDWTRTVSQFGVDGKWAYTGDYENKKLRLQYDSVSNLKLQTVEFHTAFEQRVETSDFRRTQYNGSTWITADAPAEVVRVELKFTTTYGDVSKDVYVTFEVPTDTTSGTFSASSGDQDSYSSSDNDREVPQDGDENSTSDSNNSSG